jgi:hypothetical protein
VHEKGQSGTVTLNAQHSRDKAREAADSRESSVKKCHGITRVMNIGTTCVTTVVLAYSAFAYWIFRGKTPENGWGG